MCLFITLYFNCNQLLSYQYVRPPICESVNCSISHVSSTIFHSIIKTFKILCFNSISRVVVKGSVLVHFPHSGKRVRSGPTLMCEMLTSLTRRPTTCPLREVEYKTSLYISYPTRNYLKPVLTQLENSRNLFKTGGILRCDPLVTHL